MTDKPFIDLAQHCYGPQNALSLAFASELSYRDEAAIKNQVTKWGYSEFRFFENKKSEKQAFIAASGKTILIVFRGTDTTVIKDWLSDANFILIPTLWGQAHSGFQYALDSIWSEMKHFLESLRVSNRELWIVGHSLGGAMAMLATAALIKDEQPVFGLYTFGQPPTGDRVFAKEFAARMNDRYFRFVNHNDIVPRSLPAGMTRYQHAGQKRYFDRNGSLHRDPHGFFQFWDQWICKWTVRKILEEDISDHMMANYIKNLQKISPQTFATQEIS